jgi:putative ABC transport system permease protein
MFLMNGSQWWNSVAQDIRYAGRSLRSSPAFTTVAVLTLAIGIASTTAIFSAVNATLLRPLPFPHAEQLVSIRTRFMDGRVTTGLVAPIEIGALNSSQLPITGAAGILGNPFEATLLRDDGTSVELLLSGVTDGLFQVLGIPMTIGRGFTHEDFLRSGPNAPMALVLSDRLWTEMFGRDPSVVGKTVRIAELSVSTTIVGVAGPGMDLPRGTDFWFAMRVNPQDFGHSLEGILRLRPGANVQALRSGAAAAMADLARTLPIDIGREYVMQPLLAFIVGDLGSTLLIVLFATAMLLLLACVNVTDLLLARGAVRTRELAMRAALGASRGRLIRQLLTEALVLACAGAVFGVGLGFAGVRLLLVLGASKLSRLTTVPFDTRVLLFAIAVLIFSTLAMGLAPALRLARTDMRTLLNESGRSATLGRSTSRSMSTLITAEIALAIILTACSGWLIQSFTRLEAVDPGYTPTGRIVIDVKSIRRFSNPEQAHAWWDAMLEHVRTVPGVAAAGSAMTFPLRADRDGSLTVGVQGEVVDANHPRLARSRMVTPDFFKAMGITVLTGRDFSADDRQGTVPVAIVNQAFVHTFLGTRNPLTAQFTFGLPLPDPKSVRTIVGVVPDIRYASLGKEADPAFYLSEVQSPFVPLQQPVVVAARVGNAQALIPGIRSELMRFDPQIVLQVSTPPQIIAATLSNQRLGMRLMLIFGALALVLAAIGIYGVIAYASAQRRTELATRVALGASTSHVFWLVMRRGQWLAVIGIVVGLVGAYAGGRIVASSVYAIRASDPAILITASVVVAVIAFLAMMIPAISATRLDPVRGLRQE